MKLDNKTHYRTDHLRALIHRVARDEFDTQMTKRLVITVKYQRAGSFRTGCAHYGSPTAFRLRMWLFLPRPPLTLDAVQLAHTIAHEMGHCRGLRHRDMQTVRYGWVDGWKERYAYADSFPIEREPDKPKQAADARYNMATVHAAKMVEQWQTKVKRAQTILKKWQRRERYYMTKVAALATKPVQP